MMQRLLTLAAILILALMLTGAGCDDDSDLVIQGGGGDGGTDDGGTGGGITGAFFDQGGFLLNENLHPLQDNIDPVGGASSDIFPATPVADQTSCPAGTVDPDPATIQSVTLFAADSFFSGGGLNPVFPVCVINGDFDDVNEPAGGYRLTNDHVYLLTTSALIGNGGIEDTAPAAAPDVTLAIESGVQIYALEGTRSSLRVTRGSTLNIEGTAEQPVLMAAVEATAGGTITGDPTNLTGRGDWGGLVIDGYAPTNSDSDTGAVPNEIVSEAAPVGAGNVFFGGDDPTDSSGTITYVIIGESGFTFAPDLEVQGLTIEAVGLGTTINHVQVFGSEDDGIEWFGGTVDVGQIVINGQDDDGLDMDSGYTGTVFQAIVQQGKGEGDNTVEADNAGPGPDAEPIARPIIANATLLGWGDSESEGMLLRRGFGGDFENVVLADRAVVGNVPAEAVFVLGCFLNTEEVDEELEALGIAYFCANGAAVDVPENLFAVWSAGQFDEDGDGVGDGPVTFTATEDAALTVDPATYVVTTSAVPDSTVSVAENYFGAVDPNAATPFWQGWTVHIANQ